MKRIAKNFWRTMLSFGLLASMSLPPASLANVKADTPHIPLGLVKDAALDNYSQLAAKYLSDCDHLVDKKPRPSGEELKRCLTIIKELRDKFDGFTQRLTSITDKIKNEGKWTKELDESRNHRHRAAR